MSHTSGIWNYANQDYIDYKKEYPNYRWTRNEQLNLTTSKGVPLGAPGSLFHYSDANYLLLTEIIESLTYKPFYKAMQYTVVVLSNTDDDGKSGASKIIDDIKTIVAGNKR